MYVHNILFIYIYIYIERERELHTGCPEVAVPRRGRRPHAVRGQHLALRQ